MGLEVHLDGQVLKANSLDTSRKVCQKNPQLFSHCGSFDDPALQLLNNYIFFLCLPIDTLGILRLVLYCWKCLENTFLKVYHMPQDI